MNRTRNFFASLRFPNQQPLFTQKELEEPTKWLKRLLMARIGLITVQELETQIHRYSLAELALARTECFTIASSAAASKKNFMIVLKVVPKGEAGLLRNFRIYSPGEVDGTFQQIEGYCEPLDQSGHKLWFCLSIIDPKTLSLGGRITLSGGHRPNQIEMTWYTSPRRIEEFVGVGFPFPFWRAIRPVGKLAFRTDFIHVPEDFLVGHHDSVDDYLQDARLVLRRIWQYSTAIEDLCNVLFAAGVNEVSLEFILNAGILTFIDWDTEQDLFQ